MPFDSDQGLFDWIIFISENHGHHLWKQARETQDVEYIKRHNMEDLPGQWHVTRKGLLKYMETPLLEQKVAE